MRLFALAGLWYANNASMQAAIDTARDTASGRSLPRTVLIAWVVSVVLVVLAGVAMVVQPWFVLRRFGGEAYIARIVALDVLHDWGAWGAAIVTSLHVTCLTARRLAPCPRSQSIRAAFRRGSPRALRTRMRVGSRNFGDRREGARGPAAGALF